MAATDNCEKKWLVSRRKRNRDIRDFIPVHGKILKPSLTSLTAYRGERDGERKQQVPLAKLQEEKLRNNKVPATAFSTGVRRKAPVREVHDDNSSDSVDFSSTATWEENWHTRKRVDREQSSRKASERARGKENRVTNSPRKKTGRKNALSLSSKTSPAVNPGFSPSMLSTVPSTPSKSPATATTPSPSLLTTVPHTPVLSSNKSPSMDPQTPSPSLLTTVASTPQVLHSNKSPSIDPALSPSLLRSKHTVACSPPPSSFPPITTETPPITIGKTSPGELFSPSDDEKSSKNEEFDCSLLSLSPEKRSLVAELEECERLCDRLLALT